MLSQRYRGLNIRLTLENLTDSEFMFTQGNEPTPSAFTNWAEWSRCRSATTSSNRIIMQRSDIYADMLGHRRLAPACF